MYQRILAVAVVFLGSVVLTNGGTGTSSAAGKQETSKTTSVQSQAPKQVFDGSLRRAIFVIFNSFPSCTWE